jgi:tetrachlorobenzoquinone reductase
VIAVSHDRNSRGGSRYLFEHMLVGSTMRIRSPANNFRLAEDARHSVLIAGGIGITPLYCMIQRLEELSGSWELHYAVRDRASCAFLAPLMALERKKPDRVHINCDLEDGRFLDLSKIIGGTDADAHLYCCGPAPMLEEFKAQVKGRSVDTVHLEYFTEAPLPDAELADGTDFTVTIASSGRKLKVPAGKSILNVLLEAGINADSACQAGACGTCAIGVLVGIPDHQDYVLTAEERLANNKIMVCVSRSKSENLVLDL